jgi:hypothetical protein
VLTNSNRIKKTLLAAAAFALLATAAHAGSKPQLPTSLLGDWCSVADSRHVYQPAGHCPGTIEDEVSITPNGFTGFEMACRLRTLTPTRSEHRDVEFRATFACASGEGWDNGKPAKPTTWTAYYWIGLYSTGELFMHEANSTFTAVKKNG